MLSGLTAWLWAMALAAQELNVMSSNPRAHALSALPDTSIAVSFDRPVDRDSVTARQTFWAFGRWSGPADGRFVYTNNDREVSLIPERPFAAGETVTVILSEDLRALDGSPLRAGGYSFQFWVRAQAATLSFTEVQRFSTRTSPTAKTQSYGGVATDLNRDGRPDLTIVNEMTADLRVFLNKAKSGFDTMLPPSPTGRRPSPSEPADFNADGFVDLCTANILGDSVSVVLGNGDGTFQQQQEIKVGDGPRGIAVLDADGDGDLDIINTNSNSNSLSLLRNNGQGVFAAPEFFGSGTDGEWALASADMNDDGFLDLVVGGRSSQTVRVYLSRGDGTFSARPRQTAGGSVWMLVSGDINNDGHEDVSLVTGHDNTGVILFGDGTGGLGAPVSYPVDPFSLATDLADLDGDGDLDWITASFDGDWFLFENDGAGRFSFNQAFDAAGAASCSLALDADNDGAIDLALIDEIADEVIILRQTGGSPVIFTHDFETAEFSDNRD